MIVTTCKGNGWRQEIKPWGYHQIQKQATGTGEGLKISHEIKRFQFLDNTCFYDRLRYTSYTAAPYGFHIKLSLFGIFISHSISCSIWYQLWGILDSKEGNGTQLQYSCLENPMDRGACYAAVHGVLRVGHGWVTSLSLFTFMHWRRKWQPIPGFLSGESQGRGSLVGCCLWGRAESDTTEAT